MTRARLRDLGITIGNLPTGHYNAITDVSGVTVGHTTLIYDEPRVARTGVTIILPRGGSSWNDNAPAAYHVFNGAGEMTGMHWLNESGLLCSPIGLTNTHEVGLVRDSLVYYGQTNEHTHQSSLPVVAETWDGGLNDIEGFHVTKDDAFRALDSARGGPVTEGAVGGGTGMICHDFKGGIGTSSRIVSTRSGDYTVGVLVQTNYGDRRLLRVDGAPVGLEIGPDVTPVPGPHRRAADGSIIVIIATDAPLIPTQCRRLAKRATVGLARAGGRGHNGSGDIFPAFATGNHVPDTANDVLARNMLPHRHLNLFFEAVAEATEESILNALTSAETMTGFKGRTVYELPLDELQRAMAKYSRREAS